jgi:hypothetical protein
MTPYRRKNAIYLDGAAPLALEIPDYEDDRLHGRTTGEEK